MQDPTADDADDADDYEGLDVEVAAPDLRVDARLHRLHQGQLYDLTAAGAGVAFSPQCTPTLALGELTEIRFTGALLQNSVDVTSRVHHWKCLDDRQLIGFKFLSAEALLQSLPETFREQLSHCDELPIQSATGASFPATVTSETEAVPRTGKVYDISPTSITVDLPAGSRRPCRTAPEVVRVSFYLPESEECLRFVGDVRHRVIGPGESHFRIGIEFDAQRTGFFERKQILLDKYVSDRRRRELRRVLDSLS